MRRSPFALRLSVAVGALLLASSATAQVTVSPFNRLYSVGAELMSGGNARSVQSVGDLNQDGIPDMIVTSATFSSLGAINAISGKNGSNLWSVTAHTLGALGNRSMALVNDINQDGRAEVLIGAPSVATSGVAYSGRAEVRSGLNGALLFAFDGSRQNGYFGSSVSSGDVNGDGTADAIVCGRGMPEAISPPSASYCRAFSLLDGSLLWELNGTLRDGFGTGLAAIGDITGDQRADFVVSRPTVSLTGTNSNEGVLEVRSGANGQLISTYHGQVQYGQIGKVVSSLGDINNDGSTDIVISSYAGFVAASAKVYSIVGGQLTPRLTLALGASDAVQSISSIVDLTNDGVRDVAVGLPYATNPYSAYGVVKLLSGSDGQLLRTINSGGQAEGFGMGVADVGDVNGDGDREFAVLASSGPTVGSVSVFSAGNKNEVLTGCGPLPGQSLQILGTPVPGNTVTLVGTIPEAANSWGGFWGSTLPYGYASTVVSVNSPVQCRTGLDIWGAAVSSVMSIDSNGQAFLPISIPANPLLSGVEFKFNFWAIDSTGRVYATKEVVLKIQ